MMTKYVQTKKLKTEKEMMGKNSLASGVRYYYLPAALYYGF